jgi:Na+/melibiose symporter-like transporter
MMYFFISIITTMAAGAVFIYWMRARLSDQTHAPVLALVSMGCGLIALAQWMNTLSVQWGLVGPHRVFAHIELFLAAFCLTELLIMLKVRPANLHAEGEHARQSVE